MSEIEEIQNMGKHDLIQMHEERVARNEMTRVDGFDELDVDSMRGYLIEETDEEKKRNETRDLKNEA